MADPQSKKASKAAIAGTGDKTIQLPVSENYLAEALGKGNWQINFTEDGTLKVTNSAQKGQTTTLIPAREGVNGSDNTPSKKTATAFEAAAAINAIYDGPTGVNGAPTDKRPNIAVYVNDPPSKIPGVKTGNKENVQLPVNPQYLRNLLGTGNWRIDFPGDGKLKISNPSTEAEVIATPAQKDVVGSDGIKSDKTVTPQAAASALNTVYDGPSGINGSPKDTFPGIAVYVFDPATTGNVTPGATPPSKKAAPKRKR